MPFRVKNSQFITSAAHYEQWPKDDIAEICLVGRSNVGKSSFINLITHRRRLAYVASRPGKTQLLNFFNINNNEIRLVDAPGYGYSALNKNTQKSFEKLMQDYLINRDNLRLVCLLLDLRHKPSVLDVQMFAFLSHYGIPLLVVGTKRDKISNNVLSKHLQMIREGLGVPKEFIIIPSSSLKKTGINEFWEAVWSYINVRATQS